MDNDQIDSSREDAGQRYDVFISYRRDTGLDLARGIAYWFRLNGCVCFLDQTELLTGQFNKVIYSAIDKTKYLLLLLTEGALDRCLAEGDWVREEIAYAESKGVKIVPVTSLDDFEYPDLPKNLEFLKWQERGSIDREKNFESTLRELVRRQMPDIDKQIEMRDKLTEAECSLMKRIRLHKTNDGEIDDEEMKDLKQLAQGYGISEFRLNQLIDRIEDEVVRENEDVFTQEVMTLKMNDGRIDAGEHERLGKLAEQLGIDEKRAAKLIVEAESTRRAQALRWNWKMLASSAVAAICFVAMLFLGYKAWKDSDKGDLLGKRETDLSVLSEKLKAANASCASLRAQLGKAEETAASEREGLEKSLADLQEQKSKSDLEKTTAETRVAEMEVKLRESLESEKKRRETIIERATADKLRLEKRAETAEKALLEANATVSRLEALRKGDAESVERAEERARVAEQQAEERVRGAEQQAEQRIKDLEEELKKARSKLNTQILRDV